MKNFETYELKIDLGNRVEYMNFHSLFALRWFCNTKLKNAQNVETYVAINADTGEVVCYKEEGEWVR